MLIFLICGCLATMAYAVYREHQQEKEIRKLRDEKHIAQNRVLELELSNGELRNALHREIKNRRRQA